ncbi:MAG: hypothetical protein ICV78_11150 [Tolypothrix sp. Co-bin9]|nr:hypothetical protein [Tolypothrix sp. Co-bin9]
MKIKMGLVSHIAVCSTLLLCQLTFTPKVTNEKIIPAPAGGKLSKEQLKSKLNATATSLERRGFKISRTIIKEKILELYPNADDWSSDDAKKEVMRVIEKEHKYAKLTLFNHFRQSKIKVKPGSGGWNYDTA